MRCAIPQDVRRYQVIEKVVMVTDASKTYDALMQSHDRSIAREDDPVAVETLPDTQFVGGPDCVLANTLVSQSTKPYVLLVHQSYTGVWGYHSESRSGQRGDEIKALSMLVDVMDAYGTGTGGFSDRSTVGLEGLHPIDTVQPCSPIALLIQKDGFLGFNDLPYPYMMYDYMLRSLYEWRCLPRLNFVKVDSPEVNEGALGHGEFTQAWEDYVVWEKPKGKRKGPKLLRFKGHVHGVA